MREIINVKFEHKKGCTRIMCTPLDKNLASRPFDSELMNNFFG